MNKNDSASAGLPHGQQKRRKSRFLNFSTVSWGSQDSSDEEGEFLRAAIANEKETRAGPTPDDEFFRREDDGAGAIANLGDEPASSGSLRSSYFDSNRVLRVADAIETSSERKKPFCVRGLVLLTAACIVAGAGVAVREAVLPLLSDDARNEPQRLLEIAERVVVACGESNLSDPSECRELCDEYMCCFEGEGSCAEDENNDCAVYAGCEALVIEAQGL